MTENDPPRPFSTFNFHVELTLPGDQKPLCQAAFSECDGLEMTMTPQTIREGGNNNRPIHLLGPVAYGQLSLKRGMTDSFDLWTWFDRVRRRDGGGFRASGLVRLKSQDRERDVAVFKLSGCLPTKLRAPSFNAKDGQIAVEEMQIAYERLELVPPGTAGA